MTEHATADESVNHPKMLLVDGNAINLEVMSMYAGKCSKGPSVLAGGGQQAIDLFKDASASSSKRGSPGPDIVVLDLLMLEVSGFDVASAIRNMEGSMTCGPRAYAAALTGVVSDKNRRAAFEAGVDEYITKPATVKDLQSVIANWRIANGLQAEIEAKCTHPSLELQVVFEALICVLFPNKTLGARGYAVAHRPL
jgi:CheY-like chemotaxis protein